MGTKYQPAGLSGGFLEGLAHSVSVSVTALGSSHIPTRVPAPLFTHTLRLDFCARHSGNLKTSYRSIVLAFFETRKLRFPWQVRPFTLGQLKELLGRTGTLVEEAFWIDKIKSHCFVTVRGGS